MLALLVEEHLLLLLFGVAADDDVSLAAGACETRVELGGESSGGEEMSPIRVVSLLMRVVSSLDWDGVTIGGAAECVLLVDMVEVADEQLVEGDGNELDEMDEMEEVMELREERTRSS